MNRANHHCSASVAVALMLACLLAWPTVSLAQLGGLLPTPTTNTSPAVVGNASAVQATVLGFLGTATTTVLADTGSLRSEEHTSVQSRVDIVCRLLLEKK